MTDLDDHKKGLIEIIKAILGEHQEQIAFAYLFGSFLNNYYKPGKSDIDIGVYYRVDQDFYQINNLAYKIQKAIPSHPEIDIVQMQIGNLIVNHQIFKKGMVLVDFDHDLHLRFFATQHSMYIDFKYSRKELEKGLGRRVLINPSKQ